MWNGMLPIGSVVLLKGGEIPIMVTGFCQVTLDDEGNPGELYDYVGVPYPAGFTKVSEMIQFDHNAVDRVLAIGFINEDMLSYMPRIQEIMDGLKDGSVTLEQLLGPAEEDS